MSYSWIKLYDEILDDPKMGRMPDWLWRRAIELFLLAGRNRNDGQLQPVPDMAYTLRTSEEKLTESLRALSEVGVVHEAQPGQWVVTHFAKRQERISNTDRVRDYRKRQRNADETERFTDETRSSISSSSSDSVSSSDLLPEKEQKPPKANQIEEIVLFRRAAGMYPPRPSFETVVDSMHKIAARLKRAPGVGDLRPFLTAWTDRGYKPNNLAWLTDWAVKGAVPRQGPNGHKPADRAGETDEERAARINAAIRSVQSDYGAEEANT